MVKIVYEPENNRVAAYDGGVFIGESTYSKSENLWIIDHTQVESNYGGQGIGSKLVAKLVEEARNNNTKIMPLCPLQKENLIPIKNMVMF